MARSVTRDSTRAKRAHLRRNRFAGTYSLRFAGFGLGPQSESFHLTGVGRIKLHANKTVSGSQYSSLCPISTGLNSSVFLHAKYNLEGTYAIDADGTGTVSIDFVMDEKVVQKDVFRVVASNAAGRHFWIISTHPTKGGNDVLELVSGEAVRLR
jgi:hypothetical protein